MGRNQSRCLARQVRAALLISAAMGVGACGAQSSPASTAPDVVTGATVTISGTVTNTQNGAPVPFAFVKVGSNSVEADAAGAFSLAVIQTGSQAATIGMAASRVAAGSPAYVEHGLWINTSAARSGIELNVIQNAPPFSSTIYRQFVRDAYDDPPGNETLRRWTVNPSFYIRTVQADTGAPVPAVIASELETMFRNSVPELTGGKFSVAAIESGTAARSARDGWVNVILQSVLPTPGAGGQATIGGNSGTIWLQFDSNNPKLLYGGTACSFATGAAEHEVVHAMGFYHVGPIDGIDKPFQSPDFCSGRNRPEIIRYHAAIAYARPVGNAYPDVDPSGALAFSSALPAPMAVCPIGLFLR